MISTRRSLMTGVIAFGMAPAIVRASSLMAINPALPPSEYWVKEVWTDTHVEYWSSDGQMLIRFDAGRRTMRSLLRA
jgi:hypothetical protein